MITELRKRHLQVWALWAVLLPMGIIVGYLAVPKKKEKAVWVSINGPGHVLPGPEIEIQIKSKQPISSFEGKNYNIAVIGDSAQRYLQLQFELKSPLTTASMLLYKVVDPSTNNIDKQELIGRIQQTGYYNFPFKPDSVLNHKYLFYDIIKKNVFDSVTLKISL